ncbi:DNA-directed RNA polymerase subunit beta [Frankliniella fusca]|uniref:DNA-directed RNA polymerase subunit beta n=1 Tax=Frankliniella fusca TaxID=407009 RepID=A0AAE1HNV3_9NEOP|nr:DNA-directed RNA polymerase subunit beta [Frankliniella fusca]KAK3924789.1 DNA-directed RNA polymerase subunit beta [Frankliniella fusca]KAK3929217.1 DNA-directed RNA polymerase subunit beta [Frankliniella fusca]KAK3931392.1 DNA-directed RNA polymerase subunit beta [Frankliniella fusca]
MARAFSQDPLEQHYSQQRGNLGGSSHPNSQQFLRTQVTNAMQGQLRSKRRKANVEDDDGPTIVSSEPLPKKKKTRK